MTVVIWKDGRFLTPEEPALSAVDHGVTVGDGLFETCAVYGGQAFALSRHLRRLARSAAGLGLEAPDEAMVRRGVGQVLERAGEQAGRLRITVTAGAAPLGSMRGDGPLSVLVAAGPVGPAAVTNRVVRLPWVRNERSAVAGLKTTSYAENVVGYAYAAARGADEGLLANTVGALCEGTASNVFVERDGELLTPHLTTGPLAGITRELLLEWGVEEGLPVREARPDELPFTVLDDVATGRVHLALAGSIRNVVPVVALDGQGCAPGPLCLAAQELFTRRAGEQIDP
ncbi:branched-chain amino acid aminotransferase [Sanguibacter gelidistatuariae]|uniref:Branched-chain amino acid aminotransferase n=1 Tax=Sanguibacter gelidistatuariae TaxID=1814289 RepID=A0A1G6K1R0_9MICO|nr:aminotransferase class IV [Sanguibacter gelidistatuariae]SDC24565.1 branched-chain amino acid aminotransferase [Sanguibacter gelidistatuariae]